jgi:hypothetical protein
MMTKLVLLQGRAKKGVGGDNGAVGFEEFLVQTKSVGGS